MKAVKCDYLEPLDVPWPDGGLVVPLQGLIKGCIQPLVRIPGQTSLTVSGSTTPMQCHLQHEVG